MLVLGCEEPEVEIGEATFIFVISGLVFGDALVELYLC